MRHESESGDLAGAAPTEAPVPSGQCWSRRSLLAGQRPINHISTVRYPARPKQSLTLSNKSIDPAKTARIISCTSFDHDLDILLGAEIAPSLMLSGFAV